MKNEFAEQLPTQGALDHLLKIEAEAVVLVRDAQAEADRRQSGNEEEKRAAYEEMFRDQTLKYETLLKKEKEILKKQYRMELDDYCKEISSLNVNIKDFTSLFNEYIAGKGRRDAP